MIVLLWGDEMLCGCLCESVMYLLRIFRYWTILDKERDHVVEGLMLSSDWFIVLIGVIFRTASSLLSVASLIFSRRSYLNSPCNRIRTQIIWLSIQSVGMLGVTLAPFELCVSVSMHVIFTCPRPRLPFLTFQCAPDTKLHAVRLLCNPYMCLPILMHARR